MAGIADRIFDALYFGTEDSPHRKRHDEINALEEANPEMGTWAGRSLQ